MSQQFDPALARIISQVESSQFPYALRFEPATYAELATLSAPAIKSLDLISKHNDCDYATAKVIYSTSWGLYQLMGFNLYGSLALNKSVGQFMADTMMQQQLYAQFLESRSINSTWSNLKTNAAALREFALRYNGSDQYANRMIGAAKALGL